MKRNISYSVCIVLFALVAVTSGGAQNMGASANWTMTEEGMASWYGQEFAGRQTSNGEIFRPELFTAAHKTLPFGTVLKVTNLSTGVWTTVRINDRGPFKPGRMIDLSQAAADAIGLTAAGVGRVRIEASELAPVQQSSSTTTSVSSLLPVTTTTAPVLVSPIYVAPPEPKRTIQVIAVSTLSSADNVVQHLGKNQLSAIIEPSPSGKYRVLIPGIEPYALDAAVNRLALLGYSNVLIRQQ